MTQNTLVRRYFVAAFAFAVLALPRGAAAQVQVPAPERICDPQFEDCRQPILDLISNETLGIDVGFWYMTDARYVNALIAQFDLGVPVRILVDSRANPTYTQNATTLSTLANHVRPRDGARIPMREKFGEDVLHWKMMLFHGQNMVNFSKGNFEPFAYVAETPNWNYEDEAVFFTNDDRITNSFRRRFDDRWVDTTVFRKYANVDDTKLTRNYPLYPIDSSMSFSADYEDFTARWIARMDLENVGVDAIVFRVMEDRAADAVIRAVNRGVPVRLIGEPQEYRNLKRLPDSKEIDRMYMGGVQIKFRQHEGLTHEALILLRGLGETIFGSANWTLASAVNQDEHNIFVTPTFGKPWFFDWFSNQFINKWNNTTNFVPFQPLPPDAPIYYSPNNGSALSGTSVTLSWDGGPWSWFYDVYFGTTSNPPLYAANFRPSHDPDNNGTRENYTINNLQPGTTYFWKIVDKTWAQQTAQKAPADAVWSFTTSGSGGTSGSLPFGGTPWPVPGKIEAENFDEGGQFVSYYDTTPGNAYGAYRSTDVDIEGSSDAGGGGFDVAKTKQGEWLKYTINVTAAGTYPLTMRVASAGSGATMHVEVDDVNKTGAIPIPNTGGWQIWQTTPPINVAFTAGTHTLRVAFDTQGSAGGVGNYNWLQIGGTSSPPPPPSGSTPFQGTPASIPGKFQAENFDEGGSGVAYSDTTPGNAYGAYRPTDVDIEATSDSGGGYDVAKVKATEWLKYTVNVTASGTYPLTMRVANVGAGARLHVEVDGTDRTGPINVPDTGGWQTWVDFPGPSISLTAGSHVIRVYFEAVASGGGAGNYNWFQIGAGSVASAGNTPFGGTAPAVPTLLEAENFDEGGSGIAYFDTSPNNAYGAYRSTDVDIESSSGGYDVAKTKPGEWLKYTINAPAPGTYPLTIRVANVGAGGSLHLEVDGTNQTGPIVVPDTGGWQTWTMIPGPSISLSAGIHVIRAFFEAAGSGGGSGNYDWFRIGS